MSESTDRSQTRGPGVTAPEPHTPGWRTISADGFVPVPLGEVWALVATPSRRLEWDGGLYESMDRAEDGTLTLHTRATRPDGSPSRIASFPVQARVHGLDPGAAVSWIMIYPSRPSAAPQILTVQLEPDGESTRIRMSIQVPRARGLAGVVRAPLTPLLRTGLRQYLTAKIAGVSRRLR